MEEVGGLTGTTSPSTANRLQRLELGQQALETSMQSIQDSMAQMMLMMRNLQPVQTQPQTIPAVGKLPATPEPMVRITEPTDTWTQMTKKVGGTNFEDEEQREDPEDLSTSRRRAGRSNMPPPIQLNKDQAEEEASKEVDEMFAQEELSVQELLLRSANANRTVPILQAPNARKSMLIRQMEAMDHPQHTNVVTFRKQYRYDHIVLSSHKTEHVIKFIHELAEFHLRYREHIENPASMLTPDVRDILMAIHNISETQMRNITCKELSQVLQATIRPESVMRFLSILEQYTEFDYNEPYPPTPLKFEPFFQALLKFQSRFLRVYESLIEFNAHNIPPCTDKRGGLIRCFVRKIKFGYGDRTLQNMGNITEYNNIHKFVHAFLKVAKAHNRVHIQALATADHFGGPQFEEAKRKTRDWYRNKDDNNNNSNNTNNISNNHKFHKKPQRVNAMLNTREDSDDDVNRVIDPLGPYSDEEEETFDKDVPSRPRVDEDGFLDEDDDDSDDEPVKGPGNGDDIERLILQAIQGDHRSSTKTVTKKPKNEIGCYRQVIFGKCSIGQQCEYSHKTNHLQETWKYYKKIMDESPYKSASTVPTSILRNPGGTSKSS